MRPPGTLEKPVVPRVGEAQSILLWPIGMLGMVKRSPGPALALLTAALGIGAGLEHNWSAVAGWVCASLGAITATRWQQYTLNLEKHVVALFSVAREPQANTGHRDRSDEQVPGNTPDQDQRP